MRYAALFSGYQAQKEIATLKNKKGPADILVSGCRKEQAASSVLRRQ